MRLQFAVALAISIAWAHAAAAQEPAAVSSPLLSPTSTLTPAEAVAHALKSAPRAAAAAARLRAAEGGVAQAGVWPNPEFGVEIENFQGTGAFRGIDSVEATFGLSQTIELGGKRGARIGAAEAARTAAGYDLSITQLQLIRDVRTAFTEAVAAESAVRLAEEQVRLAQEVERSVRARVDAGREPLVQQNRAEIALRQAELALERARRRTTVARQELSSLSALDVAGQQLDSSWFDRTDLPAPPPEAMPDTALTLSRRQADVLRSRAELELERSRAVPDLTVSAGIRHFRETDDNAFLVGLSIPIPIYDRNRGAIERAGAEFVAAEADLAAARRELHTEIRAARARLAAAQANAGGLRATILPKAEQAFSFAQEGYRQGKFSYLDVLDAQRTLFEARSELIDALQMFHDTRAELDRLTGTPPEGKS